MSLLLPLLAAALAAPPQPAWAPMAEDAAPDHRLILGLQAGFQDAVLVAEPPFSGLGLLPGVPFPLQLDATVDLNPRPLGVFDRVQLHTALLVQHANTLPVAWSVRLLSRPGPLGLTFGVEPHFVSGLDLNLMSTKLYASRRWDRGYVTAGGQLGVSLARPSPAPLWSAVGAVGIELIDDRLALSVEGGTGGRSRHQAMLNLALDVGRVRLHGGGRLRVVDGALSPGFQAAIAVPL
ncbi:MAG: hypothetical protein H6739_31015 [Alphaproteobacteria bacterium]|nr:hypothetical protein [Alphaproteobacteria bacterium]